MKVLLFVNGFPDARRPGNGVFNQRTATELAKRVDLTVVVPMALRPGRPRLAVEELDGMRVVRIAAPVAPGTKKLTLRLFRRFVEKPLGPYLAEADLVHSVGAEFAGLLAGALRGSFPYRHVTQMINDLRCLRAPAFEEYPYFDELRGNLHGILCNSRALEETARELFPDVKVVKTAYRGTDLALFNPEGPPAEVLGDPAGIRFLFLGGLPPYADRVFGTNTKGGLTLMEAWRLGEEALDRQGATLFFGGPSIPAKTAESWLRGLRHPEAVRIGGQLRPEDVPRFLRTADIVLIPSLEEGCPNLAFEALASGTAVLGSDIGPLSETVGDGECGWGVPAGDAGALMEAMVEHSRPERRAEVRAMGQAGRTRAEILFDHRNYARTLVETYREVMTAASEGHGP